MSSLNSPVATPVEAKEFCCTFCHREFRRLEHLQRHTRRHTHEKPFSCSCGDAFSRRDLLRRHERMAHGLFNNVSHRSLNGATSTGPRSYPTENASILPYSEPSRHMERNVRSTRHFPPTHTGEWPQIRNQQCFAFEPTPLHGRFAELDKLLGADDSGPFGESVGEGYNVPIGGAHNTGPFTRSLPEVNTPVSANGNRETTEAPHQQPTILPSPPVALGAQIVPHVSHPIVTECQRERLLQSLDGILLQDIVFPSSDALTRFLAGYFTGFYPHMPFTHAPTFKLDLCSPQLSLAIFALGAASRYELSSATKLFHLSKATLTDYKRGREYAVIHRLTNSERRNSVSENDYLDELHCLLCLCWFSTWQKDYQLRTESIMLRGILAQTLRLSGLEEAPQSQMSWDTWAQHESARRTKLLTFCFLNLQSFAFDLPPIMWSHEFKLLLPCTCPEWTAPDSTTWNLLRDNMPCRQGNFQDALSGLLDTGQGTTSQCIPTPVANYVLLHGLIQIITSSHILPKNLGRKPFSDDVILLKNALRRWTIFWQRTPESNLEPLDPNGPLPFTSSALLSLAYIRNCSCVTNLHPRDFQSWNPAGIAGNLHTYSTGNGDANELPAAQHASHILGILIKLGIQYVKHNQALVWNIETALCGFECAVFLEKWLRSLQHNIGHRSFSEPEQILLRLIQDIISEGLVSMDYDGDTSNPSQINILADQVVEVWSDIMRGNSPWEFISMLGDTLVEYRRASHAI